MIKAIGVVLLSAAVLVFLSGASLAQQAKPEHPSTTEPPKAEQAKPDHPKAEQAKPEHPKADPKADPKAEHPKADPKAEDPKADPKKAEHPK